MTQLQNLKKLHQANYKFSFKDKFFGEYSFYFDIHKELIADAGFEAIDGLVLNILFDEILTAIKNKNINHILNNEISISNTNQKYFDIAQTVIIQNFLHYKGLFIQKNNNDLICRCFGVSQSELNDLAKKTESFFEFSQSTQASMGCRSCKNDTINIFLENKKDIRRFLDVPNSQWLTRCQELLNQFMETTTFDFPTKINVIKFKAGVLQVDLQENFNHFKFAFEQFLNQELDKKITIVNFSF